MQWQPSCKLNKFLAILAIFFLCIAAAFADSQIRPLPASQAFQFSATVTSPSEFVLNWRIAPGYFLYRDRVHISAKNAELTYQLPSSLQHQEWQVYGDSLRIPVNAQSASQPLILKVDFQGCSQAGFCYPIIYKTLSIDTQRGIVTEVGVSSLTSLVNNQNAVQALLGAMNIGAVWLVFLGLGLLLSLTPCVLPMVPILTGIIVGQRGVVTKRKALFLSLSYVLGMSITYAVAGVLVAIFGSSLQVWLQQPIFIAISAGIFILLAISLFEFYELRLSRHWQNLIMRWSNYHQGGTYIGTFSMGVLSTLLVSPCVTAPLIGVLMYVGQTGNVLIGGSALFVMGLGMGVPLLLVGVSAGNWLPASGPWMLTVKKVFGVMMLGMAIWMLSRVLSQHVIMLLWFALAMMVSWQLMTSVPNLIGRHAINRTLGMLVAVTAVFFLINTWRQPALEVNPDNSFKVVNSIAELKMQLDLAKNSHRPVMIDFYADWCESCLEMDKKVFADHQSESLMKDFVLLRVDLTDNNANAAALLQKYDVIAPPTILFFNAKGQEVNSRRIVGEVNAREFFTRLNLFFAEGCDSKQYC